MTQSVPPNALAVPPDALISLNKAVDWLQDSEQERLCNAVHLAIWSGALPVHSAQQKGDNTRLSGMEAARRFPRGSDGLWAELSALVDLARQSRLLDTSRALSRHHRRPKEINAYGFYHFLTSEAAVTVAAAPVQPMAAPVMRRPGPMAGSPFAMPAPTPMPGGFPPIVRVPPPQMPPVVSGDDEEEGA